MISHSIMLKMAVFLFILILFPEGHLAANWSLCRVLIEALKRRSTRIICCGRIRFLAKSWLCSRVLVWFHRLIEILLLLIIDFFLRLKILIHPIVSDLRLIFSSILYWLLGLERLVWGRRAALRLRSLFLAHWLRSWLRWLVKLLRSSSKRWGRMVGKYAAAIRRILIWSLIMGVKACVEPNASVSSHVWVHTMLLMVESVHTFMI